MENEKKSKFAEEQEIPSESIRQQFNDLGANIRDVFSNAWDSQEKQKVQDDLKNGLIDLGEMLGKLADEFHIREFTKKMVDGVEEIGEKVRSGEMEDKAKTDVIRTLKKINQSLTKSANKFTPPAEKSEEAAVVDGEESN